MKTYVVYYYYDCGRRCDLFEIRAKNAREAKKEASHFIFGTKLYAKAKKGS